MPPGEGAGFRRSGSAPRDQDDRPGPRHAGRPDAANRAPARGYPTRPPRQPAYHPARSAAGSGRPTHTRGVTSVPGLYFLGLPWLHTWGSGRFLGVAEDAEHVVSCVTGSRRAPARIG